MTGKIVRGKVTQRNRDSAVSLSSEMFRKHAPLEPLVHFSSILYHVDAHDAVYCRNMFPIVLNCVTGMRVALLIVA
jgi:hypothetical protein